MHAWGRNTVDLDRNLAKTKSVNEYPLNAFHLFVLMLCFFVFVFVFLPLLDNLSFELVH